MREQNGNTVKAAYARAMRETLGTRLSGSSPNRRARPSSASNHDIGALAAVRFGPERSDNASWDLITAFRHPAFQAPDPVLSAGKSACRHRRLLEPSSEGQRRLRGSFRGLVPAEAVVVEQVKVSG